MLDEKGPLIVEVFQAEVFQAEMFQAEMLRGEVLRGEMLTDTQKTRERLLVIRTVESQPHDWLSNAAITVPVEQLVWAYDDRHRIDGVFQLGNGEIGLDHCEVRSWAGRHHHLSLLAVWFLVLERQRVEKNIRITVPQVREIFSHLLHNPHRHRSTSPTPSPSCGDNREFVFSVGRSITRTPPVILLESDLWTWKS